MSSYRQIQISSRQGSHDTSGNKNIIDFDVPDSNYDLSKSELVISTRVETNCTATIAGGGDGRDIIFDTAVHVSDSANGSYNNIVNSLKDVLIKNASMENQKLGVIGTVVDHNSLKSNLNSFLLNQEHQNDQITYGNSLVAKSQGFVNYKGTNLLNSFGDVESENKTIDIRIPLKSILPQNMINNYQSSVHGNDLKYHMELRLNKLIGEIFQFDKFASLYNNGGDTVATGHHYSAIQNFPLSGNTAADTPMDYIITYINYKSIEDSPFYVSQGLTLTATNGATASAPYSVVIKKIEQLAPLSTASNPDPALTEFGALKITFTSAVFTVLSGTRASSQTVAAITDASATLSIDKIQLNMMELISPQPAPKVLPYQYMTSLKDTFTAQSKNLSLTYMIPANTLSCFIVFPEALKTWSKQTDIANYRIIIDGKQITDSLVNYKSPKHFDLFSRACISANMQVENMACEFNNYNFVYNSGNETVPIDILAFPVLLKPGQQLLNLEIECNATGFNLVQNIIQLGFMRFGQIQ